jgi:hypothetical protein
MPHDEILKLSAKPDVLVYSLFGRFRYFRLLSCLRNSVITDRTHRKFDLFLHGVNGWLVEAASSVAIKKVYNIIENQVHSNYRLNKARTRPWSTWGEPAQIIRKVGI